MSKVCICLVSFYMTTLWNKKIKNIIERCKLSLSEKGKKNLNCEIYRLISL